MFEAANEIMVWVILALLFIVAGQWNSMRCQRDTIRDLRDLLGGCRKCMEEE